LFFIGDYSRIPVGFDYVKAVHLDTSLTLIGINVN